MGPLKNKAITISGYPYVVHKKEKNRDQHYDAGTMLEEGNYPKLANGRVRYFKPNDNSLDCIIGRYHCQTSGGQSGAPVVTDRRLRRPGWLWVSMPLESPTIRIL